ncbi:MAG: four helix bundle protein [Gemmatimonadaceae bacterium]
MQDYRKLRVHRKAHALMLAVKRATSRFPNRGYASLTNQMTTAAESVGFNIVEGCGAASQKDFARFLDISIKSTMELEYQLTVAMDYEVLASSESAPASPLDSPLSRPNRTTEKRETQDASWTKRFRKAPPSN